MGVGSSQAAPLPAFTCAEQSEVRAVSQQFPHKREGRRDGRIEINAGRWRERGKEGGRKRRREGWEERMGIKVEGEGRKWGE